MFSCSKFYVRDGALIGDFRDSLQPMVWRMELSRVHAVGFKVQQNGSQWDLGMEGTSGAFAPIASFSTQLAAANALHGISCGLRYQGWARRTVSAVLLLLLALVLASVVYSVGSALRPMMTGAIARTTSAPAAPALPLGQSMSADQALRVPPPQAN